MAKYLITGVAGFIGSSLAHELLRQGHSVRGVDNYITGKPENVAEFGGRVEFHEADIRDVARMRAACEGVDYVFHEAALASVPRSVKDPVATNDSNVAGTLNVLLAARDAG